MTREQIDRLRDEIFVLRCVVDDTKSDLKPDLTIRELRELVNSLIRAATDLLALEATL